MIISRSPTHTNETIRLNPQFAYAFVNRGNAWNYKKDYDRAIAWFNKREYDDAISDYGEAIRLNSQNAEAFRIRAGALFYQGQFVRATADLAQSQHLAANIYTSLWLYLALTRSGDNDAKSELATNAKGIKSGWPAPVVALYLGNSNPDAVATSAAHTDPKTHKEQMCESDFYIGEWNLINGKK